MQAIGTILGSVMLCYAAMAATQFRRNGLRHRRDSDERNSRKERELRNAMQACKRHVSHDHSWTGCRKFVVDRKVQETETVWSFYLTPQDRKSLPAFRPGQFLTFRLMLDGREKPVSRCYSISSHPNSDYFRITVKRVPDGLASGYLVDKVQVGAVLDVEAPRGEFCLDQESERPVVFISAGVGVTPFLSILDDLAATGSSREVVLVNGVRNGREHIMRQRLEEIEAKNSNVRVIDVHSTPDENDEEGRDFDAAGRINVDMMKTFLTSNDYDFFICGPPEMMQGLIGGLADWGVPEAAIITEAFGGPSARAIGQGRSFTRDDDETSTKTTTEKSPTENGRKSVDRANVTFHRSGKTVRWETGQTDLLSLAEQNGVQIDFGCGSGSCGTCQTPVRSGRVRYAEPPAFRCDVQACLPCVAAPDGDVVIDA